MGLSYIIGGVVILIYVVLIFGFLRGGHRLKGYVSKNDSTNNSDEN